MPVKHCDNMTEFGLLLEVSKEKLVVVDFTATWCVEDCCCLLVCIDVEDWTDSTPTRCSNLFHSFTHSHQHYYNRCGPCRYIGPIFEQLSEANPEVEFVKVDVDSADDVAAHCGVRAMPTFQFFKGGEKVGEMMGADQNKLVEMIAKHK